MVAHILYETNLHPVPEEHIGQLVYVCVGPDRLEVFDRGVPRSPSSSGFQDGAGKIAASDRKRRGRYGVTLLQARFAAWGPAAEDLGAGIPPMTDPAPPRWEANTAEPDGREGTERPKIDRDHDRDRTKLAGAWARHSSRGA